MFVKDLGPRDDQKIFSPFSLTPVFIILVRIIKSACGNSCSFSLLSPNKANIPKNDILIVRQQRSQ